jgi:hypothetical protein
MAGITEKIKEKREQTDKEKTGQKNVMANITKETEETRNRGEQENDDETRQEEAA